MAHQKETKRVYNACMAYWRLSKLLFGGGKDCVVYIWKLPKDNEFYEEARKITKELGYKWDKMTYEQSDDVTLALLESQFLKMKSECNVDVIVNVKLYGDMGAGK